MTPRTPRSTLPHTLLPYTTLFRSDGRIGQVEKQERPPFAEMQGGIVDHIAQAHAVDDVADCAAQDEAERRDVLQRLFAPHPDAHEGRDHQDRKSTRLNSSH